MKGSRLLIVLFLLATVSADLVMLSMAGRQEWWVPKHFFFLTPAMALAIVLALSQVSLVTIWASVSRMQLPWRLTGVIAVVSLWSVASFVFLRGTATRTDYSLDDFDNQILNRALILLTALFPYATGLLLARPFRLAGATLPRVGVNDAGSDRNGARRPIQFSLSYLLAWTTTVAIALGTAKYLVRYRFPFVPLEVANAYVMHGTILIALTATWAVLGARRPGRASAYLFAACSLGGVAAYLIGLSPTQVMTILLVLAQLPLLLGSLWVFRVAGYRLKWRFEGKATP